jgi:hypothetical protein
VEGLKEISERLNFFHWELAFPKVFSGENAGIDCVMGNPPWEALQLEEQEFFAERDPLIASLPGDLRKRRIAELVRTNPMLAIEFESEKHNADAKNKFLRSSARYSLSAVGKLNTYAVFAEHFRCLLSKIGRMGIIVPTGIATDYSTRFYFQDIVENKNLVSLFDFENGKAIFPAVQRNVRFCLLTVTNQTQEKLRIAAQLKAVEELYQVGRSYNLSIQDLEAVSPNTLNCPMFNSSYDAELIVGIHSRLPVLVNDRKKDNPWKIQLKQGLFNMTSDSGLFKNFEELSGKNFTLQGNRFEDSKNSEVFLPLYESKLIHQYNHRSATFEGIAAKERFKIHAGTNEPSVLSLQTFDYVILPRYWVSEKDVLNQTPADRQWFLGFRNAISATADSRSLIASLIPFGGVGHSLPLIVVDGTATLSALLLSLLNSIILDYVLKQKASGGNLTFSILEQLPVLPPSAYTAADIDFIAPRVLELVYTANDLRPFAEDMGYHGEPFRWDEVRRAQLRAELDAYYARLYGLTRDELRFILDPKEVHGEDFPGETFRVLKEKEVRLYGEYRTRRLVLAAWDGQGKG